MNFHLSETGLLGRTLSGTILHTKLQDLRELFPHRGLAIAACGLEFMESMQNQPSTTL